MDNIDRTRPVHLIINPHSGYGSSRHALGELRAEARRTGVELVEYTTRAPGDATRYAREIAAGAAAAIVWGGDGTVNEVANALAGTDRSEKSSYGTSQQLAKAEVELLYPTISMPVSIALFDLGSPELFEEEQGGDENAVSVSPNEQQGDPETFKEVMGTWP